MSPDENTERLIKEWFAKAVDDAHRLLRSGDFARALVSEDADDRELRAVNRDLVRRDAELTIDIESVKFRDYDFSTAAPIATAILTQAGIVHRQDDRRYDLLCRRIMLAMGELQEARIRWADGDLLHQPTLPADTSSPVLQPTIAASTTVVEPSLTLSDAVELFIEIRNQGHRVLDRSCDQRKAELRFLTDFLGKETLIKSITRNRAGDVAYALRSLPARFRQHAALIGKTVAVAAEESRRLSLPGMNSRTVNGYLGSFRGLFDELEQLGKVDSNPFKGLKGSKRRARSEVDRTFTDAELEMIFSQPLFIGADNRRFPYKPGAEIINDWRAWAPLIALMSGARVAEIVQLEPQDIREVDGVWVIDVNERAGKRVKTGSSIRVIPIHSELLRLGLVQLAAARAGRRSLLEGVPVAVRGDPAHGASRWMRDFLARVMGGKRVGVGFHSLRHGMVTMMRNAAVAESNADKITGHKSERVGAGYGRYELKLLQAEVEKITLPGCVQLIPSRYAPPGTLLEPQSASPKGRQG